jgi:hypothetical protein
MYLYCRNIKGNEISSNGRVSRLSHGLASLTVGTTLNTWREIGTSCTHRVLVLIPSSEFEFYGVKFWTLFITQQSRRNQTIVVL